MVSKTLFSSRPYAIGRMAMVCVVAIVFIGTGASADGPLPEEKQGDGPDPRQPKQRTLAIEVFVDLSLGLCDEQTAERRLESLKVRNLKVALEEEIEGLKRDLVGIRQVAGKQFVALTRQMETVSSGMSIAALGMSRDRAYLEVNVFLTSQHRYVAVVTTELVGLPKEVVEKLKQ